MNSEWQSLQPQTQRELKNTMNAMQPPQSIEEIKAGLETTEKGGVRQSIRNCLTVFQRDPLLSGAIAYNILTDRKDIIKPIGFHRESTALNDTDMKYLLLYLEETYGLTNEKKIDNAIGIVANENKYHPIRDYAVLSHMDPARYTPLAVGITREGQWLCYTGDLSRLEDGTWQQAADCIPCTPLVEREAHALLLLDGSGRRLLFDAVFPVLHGKNGEDGTVQGLFELAGVPVIGCGTLSSALCMDKDRAHQLAALAGIRVPRSHVFHSSDDFSRIAQAAEELGYPVFVKPVRAGSSFGITKVSGPEELPAAMEEAFRHDSAVILEETIPGFEVGCAVMGNEELTVGLVDEIALSEGFFNYEEKYTLKTSAIHCPARIPPEKAAEIQAAAKTIYRALDCRVFARVDLFLTPDGEIVFNEVNTIPGFTAHSRYPSMMQGIGISFGELVTRLIELGVAG